MINFRVHDIIPVITCLKLTKETVEQGVKFILSFNKDTRTSRFGVFTLAFNIFRTFF